MTLNTTKTISKILIANRGEIACRIIKTARKMGIATVAVYSDADKSSLHVKMADEAVHIGPSPSGESYLVIDKIIQAAKDTSADAVHPGYGFLSENPNFVRACEKAAITFIGPSADSMEAMGLKDAAKKLMDKADVPITPGYHGVDQNPDLLKAKAGMIGYPVLIKAVAGGGGKGMRKVDTDKDFLASLASCQREAKSSFGDDRVLIEKYITSPRHIEVQIFGDMHGNVVHMFERDCSLQRRHQKVIEEAPAPGMTDKVRKAMTDAAIKAAKAVNYVGAGTVEFIVDGSGALRVDGFWFMEMNTRLQVEHPVTEMITGLDLVEWQIRVARGEKLPTQNKISLNGHAIEARLYAEDPANDFLPTTGKIARLNDRGTSEYRIDTGYSAGQQVGIYYDPMIAKIIGFGEDRIEASIVLCEGIVDIHVWPLKTNSAFLINCLESDEFTEENISTHFISNNIEALKPVNILADDRAYALAAIRLETDANEVDAGPFSKVDGWRLNQKPYHVYYFEKDGESLAVTITDMHSDFARIDVNGKAYHFDFCRTPAEISLADSLSYYNAWSFSVKESFVSLHRDGNFAQLPFYKPSGDTARLSSHSLIALMPGKIIAVNAKIGDTVKAGDPLIVMEAMKMEMTLDSPRDGIIEAILVDTDALVADGESLLTLEQDEKK